MMMMTWSDLDGFKLKFLHGLFKVKMRLSEYNTIKETLISSLSMTQKIARARIA